MTCPNHPETQAVAFCRSCGKPLCEACKYPAQGTIYCAEHAPAPAAAPPPAAAATPPPPMARAYVVDPGVSPVLAGFLGLIPGVGAIYNGQYAKGIVHAIVFGLIISIMNSDHGGFNGPMLGFLMVAWMFYMVFEAYHTARKRMMGEPIDEFSSLINMRRGASQFPTGAVLLIVLGVVLLLNTLEILEFRYLARYWPVVLILAGVYMLWGRLTAQPPVSSQEVRDGHE